MEAFQYQAFDASGRKVSGVIQADSPRQARQQLRGRGLLPSSIEQVRSGLKARTSLSRGLSPADLSLVTRQMATLLGSGLTMEQS